jgi:hypothetical protein
MTSATAPVILACGSSTFAGKAGRHTLFLTNAHKRKYIGIKAEDRGAHDIGRDLTPVHSYVIVFGFYLAFIDKCTHFLQHL